MSKIKVAIIGCGNIANSAHLPAYQAASDLCEVKYFCDLIEERATRPAGQIWQWHRLRRLSRCGERSRSHLRFHLHTQL